MSLSVRKLHYIDIVTGSGTACGLSEAHFRTTDNLEQCNCKMCLKIVTQGHR